MLCARNILGWVEHNSDLRNGLPCLILLAECWSANNSHNAPVHFQASQSKFSKVNL